MLVPIWESTTIPSSVQSWVGLVCNFNQNLVNVLHTDTDAYTRLISALVVEPDLSILFCIPVLFQEIPVMLI